MAANRTRHAILVCLATAALPAVGEKINVKLEWGGGARSAKLIWDGTAEVSGGRITGVANAGLDGGRETIRRESPTRVRFISLTEGATDGIILTVDGNRETVVHFRTPLLEASATIGEIGSRLIRRQIKQGGWFTLGLSATVRARMPEQDCAGLAVDKQGRTWTVGIGNTGPLTAVDTRQTVLLGRIEAGAWRPELVIGGPGAVYFPTLAVSGDAELLLAWCELVDGAWQVRARRYDLERKKLSPSERLSAGPVGLWPDLYAGPEGIFCAWVEAVAGRFTIRLSRFTAGRWRHSPRSLVVGHHAFRPALAGDGEELVLAFDAFVGRDYDVYRARVVDGNPVEPKLVFGSAAEEMGPSVCTDGTGTIWIAAGNRLAGYRKGSRVEPVAFPGGQVKTGAPLRHLATDGAGRLWLFSGRRGGRGRSAATRAGILCRGQYIPVGALRVAPGWSPPRIDRQGAILLLGRKEAQTIRLPLPAGMGADPPAVKSAPPRAAKEPLAKLPVPPAPMVDIDGREYRLYWGELHTHLGEKPTADTIRTWVDRYYLRSRFEQGLDIGATSDHDWPAMTFSKFMVQQGIATVLSQPGRYAALCGFEWSGSGPVRKRYGDRTVVFSRDYTPIFRITDPIGNHPAALHAKLKEWGAIAWPHHVGASWAMMDWDAHSEEVEPVVEITSNHGVYETYDLEHVIAGWAKTPVGDRNALTPKTILERGKTKPRNMVGKVDRTSLQYGLGQGHRFAFVGSSDSHNGLAGYKTGMTGIYARELTREAIFEAWRARRVYAVRGGWRIQVDFRVNGVFMGGETVSRGKPRVRVAIKGTAPIEKVELVRNNRYIHSRTGDGSPDLNFEYVDMAPLKGRSYYYLRVYQKDGGYAWASPVWVNSPGG